MTKGKTKKENKTDSLIAFFLGMFGGMALGSVLEHAIIKHHGFLKIKNRCYLVLSIRHVGTIFAIGTFFGILLCLAAIGLGGIF